MPFPDPSLFELRQLSCRGPDVINSCYPPGGLPTLPRMAVARTKRVAGRMVGAGRAVLALAGG